MITGSLGMINRGILMECLNSPKIESVILFNTSPTDINV